MVATSIGAVFTALLEPRPLVILFTLLVALTLPLLIHLILYRSASKTTLPSFLLTGPHGSGKTSLMLMLERGHSAPTHTSQAPLTVEASLPVGSEAASNRYRSVNDPSVEVHKRFLLIDTPGHGKLRFHAHDHIVRPQNLRGIVFVLDAADLATDSAGLRDAADYLHGILLALQKRLTKSKTSKVPKRLPVLVAAHKSDLFTALPPALVRTTLEREISRIRSSRSKGLLDSGIGLNDTLSDGDDDWLGETGGGAFSFSQMAEVNVEVHFAAGSISGDGKGDIALYWDWLKDNM